ncbi:protein kinase domain-containing protein [Actinoplanes sp. URMC 104]|uniref:protein kinase domain-containing protein n=1 Tax=Actinoplanes sp. URMC 104 TaxID=3423409 RepID=UPI003F1E081D
MLAPGALLSDRYHLTQRLAAGGMGEVWRGEDTMLHRPVAIKVMLPALRSDREFVTRFRTEARMMAALRHPGVVQVYDYGETAEGDYLVMEFVDGIGLSRRIEQAGRLTPAETMTVVAQVADALQVAHEAGIVHRDVKPANLLVRPGGAIVLVDFGVAKSAAGTNLTGTNVVLGSANYMAPEQAEARPIGPATDVYALGAVAYCCLTGRPPYVGDNPLQVLSQLVYGDLPTLPPDVPPQVSALVLRALAKDPSHRFASAAEMASAARAASGPQTRMSSGPFTPPQARAFRQPPTGYGRPGPGTPGGIPTGGTPPQGRVSGGAPQQGFPSSGRMPAGGPTSGRAQLPGTAPMPGVAAAGGFQPGRAQAGRPQQTAYGPLTGASGAAAVPRPGASYGGGGNTGPGGPDGFGSGGPGDRRSRSRTITIAVAVAAVVLGAGGVAAATLIPIGEKEALPPAGGGDAAVEQSTPTKGATTKPGKKPRRSSAPTSRPAAAAPTTEPTEEPGEQETPEAEPADPEEVCGDGFEVLDRASLRSGGATVGRVYLLRGEGGNNCVVTVKTTGVGTPSPMSAYLELEGRDRADRTGTFDSHAGPVTAAAPATCVKWGGSIDDATYDSDFEHCD